MPVAWTRRLIGLLTLVALVAIFVGVTGFEVPLPRLGGAPQQNTPLAGVNELAAALLVRVGVGAPAGGELGFMAVEPGGNLVVSDVRRHSILRFDPSGHLLSEWGPSFGDVTLAEPAGVAVFGDTFYVIDRGTPRLFRLNASGELLGTTNLDPLGTYGMNGMAVDGGGNLYVADTGRNRILVLSPAGQLLKQIGRAGNDLGAFTQPMMLAFAPDGSFAVADWENSRIQRFDSTYEAINFFSTPVSAFGVAVDQLGRVYAPDAEHRRVMAFTPQGASLGDFGDPSGPALGVAPRQLAFARADRPSLYVLGADGIVRVDFENTPPPPQSGGTDIDLMSVLVIGCLVVFLVLAVLARRGRPAAKSGAAAGGAPRSDRVDGSGAAGHAEPRAEVASGTASGSGSRPDALRD